MENVNVDNSVGISKKGKRYLGVTKRNDKWRARIWHPKLKTSIELGYYDNAEEAAIVVQKKKAEFREMFEQREKPEFREMFEQRENVTIGATLDNVKVKNSMHISEKGERFLGVCKLNAKWQARVWHPDLKTRIGLGCYDSPEEAAAVVQKKKAEYVEMFKQKDSAITGASLDNVNVEKSMEISEIGKRFVGVSKRNGKWLARFWHSKLKAGIELGYYDTPEEAAIVVQKKKAEYDKMFKQKDSKIIGTTMDNVNVKISGAVSKKKCFPGVSRRNDKWRARVWHPKLKKQIQLGYYASREEAAEAVQKKKVAYEQMFKQNDSASTGTSLNYVIVETSGGVSEKGNCFLGVSERNGKWRARVWHPKLQTQVRLGSYGTPEEAAAAVQKKKGEFKEMFKQNNSGIIGTSKHDVIVETTNSASQKSRRCLGVSKRNTKWLARVWHPRLNTEIHLGYYGSPEEASTAVKKKKAEYEMMFERKDSASMSTIEVELDGRKLLSGVCTSGGGTCGAKNWQQGSNHSVSSGSHGSPEEAAVVEKSVKLGKMYEWRKGVEPSSKCVDDVVEEPECVVSYTSACVDECGVVKVPAGVRKTQSGKWVARIRDPDSKVRIWLGASNTFAEAVGGFNEKEAVFAAKRNRVGLDERTEFGNTRCDSEATDNPEHSECEVVGLEYSNCWAVDDTLTYAAIDDAVARDNQKINSVCGFSSSDLEPELSSGVDVIGKSVTREVLQRRTVSASSFDDAVSLGFIDEYGQLLGQHSILDEYECLNLPDDKVVLT